MPLFARYFLGIIGVTLLITVVSFFVWKPQASKPVDNKKLNTEAQDIAGVYFSEDGGASWKALAGSENIQPLVFVEKRGAMGGMYVGTVTNGLWILKNGSNTLEQISDPKNNFELTSRIDAISQTLDGTKAYLAVFQKKFATVVGLSESESEVVYKAPLAGYGIFGVLVDQSDPAHINVAVGDGTFLESRDGGRTKYWIPLALTAQGIVKLFAHPEKIGKYWALGNKNRLYVTNTAGQSWEERPAIAIDGRSLSTINDLKYIPTRDTLFAATEYGLIESLDDGKTWRGFHTPAPPFSITAGAVVAHPNFEEVFWFSLGNQIFRTDDGGISWRAITLPTNRSISMLQVDTANPKKIYAGIRK